MCSIFALWPRVFSGQWSSFFRFFVAILFFSSVVFVGCTSSRESSDLESEIENLVEVSQEDLAEEDLEGNGEQEEFADLEEEGLESDGFSEGDKEDLGDNGSYKEDGGDDEFADIDEEDFEGDGFSEEDGGDDEFADIDEEDFEGDGFSEEDGEDDEFADIDEEDSEDDEEMSEEDFAQLDGDKEEDGELSEEDKKSLAQELSQGEDSSQTPSQEFPEEVSGSQPKPPATEFQAPLVVEKGEEMKSSDTEPKIPQDDLGLADPINPEEEKQKARPSWVPVVKVKTDPFYRNNRLLNTVYIARPGDQLASICEKIFGSQDQNKIRELKEDNRHLAKGVDPGDKVYYTSPYRPEDRSALKNYYEDRDLAPQFYVTGPGENMRRLGSRLLGFYEGWKEIWAINPDVDSKTILPTGVRIKYWTGEESPVSQMAETQTKDVENPSDPPSPPDPMAQESGDQDSVASNDKSAQFDEGSLPQEDISLQLPGEEPLSEVSSTVSPSELEKLDEANLQEDLSLEDPGASTQSSVSQESASVDTKASEGQLGTPSNQNSMLLTGGIGLFILFIVSLAAIQIKNRKDKTTVNPPSLEYTQA